MVNYIAGTLCEAEIDYCINHPCIHGNCSNQGNTYLCTCETDYFGINCDEHACDEEICMHGGRCYGDGRCDCLVGWAGIICEIDVSWVWCYCLLYHSVILC